MSNQHTFAICIHNEGYEASLELRKLYEVLPSSDTEKMSQLRVIDESGEDYLYPKEFFVILDLPNNIEELISRAV